MGINSRSKTSLIVYEVQIEITDPKIAAKYRRWLSLHIDQMLKIDGFESARWLQDSENKHRISIQYMVANQRKLKEYFNKYAESMRADGTKQFPGQFTASRRIWKPVKDQPRRKHMEFRIDRIMAELSRFGNVARLRKELQKVTRELRHLQKVGTRQAKETIKTLEKRYSVLMKQFTGVQKQLDQEISKAVGAIEKTRGDVEEAFNSYRVKAIEQQNRVFGVAKKVATTAKKAAKKATKKVAKKVAKKKTAKKSTKKITKKTVAKKTAKAATKKSTAKVKTTKKATTTKKVTTKKASKKAAKKKK